MHFGHSAHFQVQNLLQLFNIPQIGYSATSRDLSIKVLRSNRDYKIDTNALLIAVTFLSRT